MKKSSVKILALKTVLIIRGRMFARNDFFIVFLLLLFTLCNSKLPESM